MSVFKLQFNFTTRLYAHTLGYHKGIYESVDLITAIIWPKHPRYKDLVNPRTLTLL